MNMIHSFKFKNFYSFKNVGEVSMLVNDKAPNNDYYFKNENFRFNKVLGILGPNGSGKTCLLRAVSFLGWFLNDSFSLKPDEEILIKPFYLNSENIKKPIYLKSIFQIENKIYQYSVELTSKRIISEHLKHKTNSGYRILFSREYNKEKNNYDFNLKNFGLDKDFESIMQKRINASIISTAYQFNHEISSRIINFWASIHNINISERGKIKTKNFIPIAEFYKNNNEIKEKVTKLLQKLDLGLSGIKISKANTEDGKEIYFPFGIHKTKDNGFTEIPLFYESSGTQNLFILLKDIVQALDNGEVVIFDEIDSDLHPQIVLFIIQLFKDKKINKKNAQIIFSTHSLLVLRELKKYQIQFTQKNKFGESKTWRLDSKKSIRLNDNYLEKYLSGKFEALPNI